jgi:hypothetical protein
MIINYKKAKSLIFDGHEQEMLHKSIDLSRETALGITIKLDDFANNTFENLQGIVSDADFAFIIKTGAFATDGGFLNLYKGSNNLRLYYHKKGNTIIVFAYGEFQPGRYMLYLEGFWTVD